MKTYYYLLFALVFAFSSCDQKPPNILIVGDSISIGYTPFVIDALGDKAVVTHNPGNAQHTGTGLLKIKEWIGTEEWDIIQFNWGLWDLAYRHEDSETQGKRDKVNGKVTFTPEEYMSNLDMIVTKIKEISNAKLLFVTTSYVPEGEAGRFVGDAQIYNDLAIEVMKKHKIRINDYYDFSKEVHQDYSTAPDNVHYTIDGYKILSGKIVDGLSSLDRRLK